MDTIPMPAGSAPTPRAAFPFASDAACAKDGTAWGPLAGIFDGAHDIIAIVNGAHQILHINRAVERILGYSKGEMLGKSLFLLLASSMRFSKEAFARRDGVFGPIPLRRKDGSICEVDMTATMLPWHGMPALMFTMRDVTERTRMEKEREQLIAELQQVLAQVRQLSGLLPICAGCKRIRDDAGYWEDVEAYLTAHTDAEFSHSICPECRDRLYPGLKREQGNELSP